MTVKPTKTVLKSHLKQAGIGSIKALLSGIPGINAAIGAWDGYSSSRLQECIDSLTLSISKS